MIGITCMKIPENNYLLEDPEFAIFFMIYVNRNVKNKGYYLFACNNANFFAHYFKQKCGKNI